MRETERLKVNAAHGGHLRAFSERFQIAPDKIIDFSSNVNPLALPESLRDVFAKCAREIGAYPDPDSVELRQEIMRHYPVVLSNILAGNGAVSLIGLAVRALAPKRALLVEPSFTEYRRVLEVESAAISSVALEEENNFAFPMCEIEREMGKADLLILGHPNSPTGTALDKAELLEILALAKRSGVFAIVDEAFADWCPEISVAPFLKEDSNFIVIRSLTKFYGLAGIRAGFALGPSRVLEDMKEYQDSWDVNVFAQRLSTTMLQASGFIEKTRAWFLTETAWLYRELNEIQAFKAFPSRANFFLIKKLSGDSQELFEFLGQRGIYIRSTEDYLYLDSSYFRVSLRSRRENEVLIQSLKEYAVL